MRDQETGEMRPGKFKANFLKPKNEFKLIKPKLDIVTRDVRIKKYGEDEKKWPKYKPEKIFLRDGDLEDWDGYEGCMYISANAMLKDKPLVLTNRKDGNGNWIEAQPGGQASPYSGCYVIAVIEVWAQDNEHGKRLNARLKSVQFFKDGEAFGAAPSNPNEDFTDDMAGTTGGYDDDDDADDMV